MTNTLRSRLMSIVLGPALVLLIAIAAMFSYGTLSDIAANERRIHQIYAEQLAAHSYLLYRNSDIAGLQQTAQTALEHPAIRSITFYDLQGQPIAHAGPIQPPLTQEPNNIEDIGLGQNKRQAMVTLPIQPMQISSQVQQGSADDKRELGWLQIQFSFSTFMLQSYQTLFGNMIALGIALIAIYTIIVKFTNHLTLSLNNLAKHTLSQELISNEKSPITEIGELQQAISRLKQQQREKLDQAQQQLEIAENDLYTTIEAIEIKNIELDMARREAVRSNNSKSEFLANTSHELRTPLNSIIGFSSLLMRTAATEQQREHARAIYDSSQNLLVLINDILDLSRLEANRFVLNNEAFDLREMVEGTLAVVASSAHLKKLELSYSIYSDVPECVIGDANRIRQIITNLLGNAIKFSDRGAVQLRVSLEHDFDTEALIHFEVRDEGPGLPNDQQATIFAPFTQLDNSHTREESGTGLGLSICYKLAQQMNGELDYHSEPGNTRFWFTVRLPVTQDISFSHDQIVLPAAVATAKALVVDDHVQSNSTTSHLLSNIFNQVNKADSLGAFLQQPEDWLTDSNTTLVLSVPVNCDSELTQRIGDFCTAYTNPIVLALPCHLEFGHLCDCEHIKIINKPITQQRLYTALNGLNSLSSAAVNKPDNSAAIAYQQTSTLLNGLRILVADDMPNNAMLFNALLKPHGAEIYCASNGLEAFELYRQQQPDIVLLDIQMPIMDGLQASQKIRQWEREQQLTSAPIIAVTAFSDNEQRTTIEAAGMNDILSKPIAENVLLKAITAHLERQLDSATATAADSTAKTAVAPNNSNDIFNAALALERSGQRVEIAQSMVKQLIASLPAEQQALSEALANSDAQTIQQIAHRLHGAACYCGTEQILAKSKHLQKVCRSSENVNREELALHTERLLQAIGALLEQTESDNTLQTWLTTS